MLDGAKKVSSGCGAGLVAAGIQYGPCFLIVLNARAAWCQYSRHKRESDAAEEEGVAGDSMAFGPGGIAHLGDIADAKRQAAHDIAETFDKAEGTIGQYYLRFSIVAFTCGNSD